MDAIEFYLFHLIEMGTKLERYVFKELKPFIIYMCYRLTFWSLITVTAKLHVYTTHLMKKFKVDC
jgi:hypothetical protein